MVSWCGKKKQTRDGSLSRVADGEPCFHFVETAFNNHLSFFLLVEFVDLVRLAVLCLRESVALCFFWGDGRGKTLKNHLADSFARIYADDLVACLVFHGEDEVAFVVRIDDARKREVDPAAIR